MNTPNTSFAATVRAVVASIPKGKVATYGQVAALAGSPGAARAVGMIMSQNKDTAAVPCHRVIGSSGALTGYAYGDGVQSKRLMLEREGVTFSGERVDLAASRWESSK